MALDKFDALWYNRENNRRTYMTKILALDQKVSGTGWCLAEDEKYLKSGYRPSKGKDGWEKIMDMGCWIQDVIFDECIDVVVLEYPSGNSGNVSRNKGNMDTNVKLGAAMYECIAATRAFEKKEVVVKPLEVKKTGVYKGQLDAASEYKTFEVPRKKDGSVNKAALSRINDEIDAIGVWRAGLERMKEDD